VSSKLAKNTPLANINPPSAFWVVRFSSLGDVVISTAVIEGLKQVYPKVPIIFITSQEYVGLFTWDSRIDQVVAFNRTSGSLISFLSFVAKDLGPRMRQEGGWVIDLHNSLRSRLLRGMVPIPTLMVVRKWTLRRLFLCITKMNLLKNRKPLCQEMVTDLEQSLKKKLKLPLNNSFPTSPLPVPFPPVRPKLMMPPNPQASREIQKTLPDVPDAASVVGLIPSAQWPGKRWPLNAFRDLIQLIHAKTPFRCAILGGGRDTWAQELARHTHAHNWVGKLDLSSVMSALSLRCSYVIANDTGLMHMADALSLPTCAILGPTTRDMGYPPLGERSFIVEKALGCRPCSRNGSAPCIRWGKRPCLRDLSAQEVFQACANRWGWHV
jgi:heptosyltransferase-2